jgi:MarR family transcriptional regulator for hemolysin
MPAAEPELFGVLLHGTARAWRLKLDARLRPMGFSQAKWRTLLHLSAASGPLTQAEIAARLGIEEPTLVTLLHRLERDGWIERKNAAHDRRCKTVHLGRRVQRTIARMNSAVAKLRHELLADISRSDLETCSRVLAAIRDKAEKTDSVSAPRAVRSTGNGRNENGHTISKMKPRRETAKS